jgi:hypothetical protein
MVHGESRVQVDFPYVARAAAAEGLDYMSLAQSWRLPDQSAEAVKRACDAVSTSAMQLTWNMEAPKNYYRGNAAQCLGHGWTIGLPVRDTVGRDVIATLYAMSAHDYESEKRTAPNFESHAYIHANGGIVSYTHPCRWWTGAWGGRGGYPAQEKQFISNLAAELPFDTVAGPTYDLLDILMQTHEREQNENALRLWFMLLNHGYRIAGTAGSDTTFDNPGRGLPGAVRIYTRVEGTASIPAIGAAMKASRNFVTSGPLLSFRIGRHDIGDSIRLNPSFTGEVKLKMWASGAPGEYLTRAEIFRNGELWHTHDVKGREAYAEVALPIRESEPCWYVVRCHGSNPRQVAISNPIWFDRDPWTPPAPARARVRVELGQWNGQCDVLEFHGSVLPGDCESSDIGRRCCVRCSSHGAGPRQHRRACAADEEHILRRRQLLDPALAMRVPNLLDWSTYDSIRRRLGDVRLSFTVE